MTKKEVNKVREVAASVTDKGQRNTCDRHQANAHCDVFKEMQEEHGHNADNDQLSEPVLRKTCKIKHPN